MNHSHPLPPNKITRRGTAFFAAMLLLSGVAWQIPAATPTSAPGVDAGAAAPAPRAINTHRDSYADIVRAVDPSVVTVHVEGKVNPAATQFQTPDDFMRRFFGERGDGDRGEPRGATPPPHAFKQRGLGSGVVVGADGYILTNNHVVDSADEIDVETSGGRTMKAKVVGADKASDLALLKVSATDLPAITMGDSDAVEVGDVVLAIGNPLGVGQTVTMGIISAKGRATTAGTGSATYEDFLQTDAAINHGNSGGALVNMKGELIGINSQILSESGGNVGIGFAIPSNMARHVIDGLRTKGRVVRSQLGVMVQGITSDLAESLGLKDVNGVLIGSVGAGSAADRAGLRRGDVIRAFDGQPVHDTNSLRNRVADVIPGSTATVTIVRDGSEMRVDVKLSEAPSDAVARNGGEAESGEAHVLGVAVAPITPELANRFGLAKEARGLLVEEVDPDGPAAGAGIRAGDVIEEADRHAVQSLGELRAAVRSATEHPLLLLVIREGKAFFVTIRPHHD